jgi:dTDP-glucose pyrophosphorylase/predicted transcriptional regulator
MIKFELKDWRKALLNDDATVQEALNCLESSSFQIALVVSNENKLVGTISDGDIRRSFLSGMTLKNKVLKAINNRPIVVSPKVDRDKVVEIMALNKISQLPIVDENNYVVGLHILNSLLSPSPIESTMVIMAGGQGKRLRPYTENCPKPMLEIGGKPILEHIIRRAHDEGFKKIIISLHYLGHMIRDYFGDGSRWGVDIGYLQETKPLGTAGCLSLLPHTGEFPILVTNGDILSEVKYRDILDHHNLYKADATMAVRPYEIQNQFGVVDIQGLEIKGIIEKPIYRSHINAGIYVLSQKVLKLLNSGSDCNMTDFFEVIRVKGCQTIAFPMHESWVDIGRPSDLKNALRDL